MIESVKMFKNWESNEKITLWILTFAGVFFSLKNTLSSNLTNSIAGILGSFFGMFIPVYLIIYFFRVRKRK